MAKPGKMNRQNKKEEEEYKFHYGTNPDMVVRDLREKNEVIREEDGTLLFDCVAKDDKGYYYTRWDIVNTSLADPRRYGTRVVPDSRLIEEIENPPKEE